MEIDIPAGLGKEGDSFEIPSEEPTTTPLATRVVTEEAPSSPSIAAEAGEASSDQTTWKTEDQTFPGSDVAIHIVLFREDAHPDGRLVQIVVKDFSDICATRTFRACQLTKESDLDCLQQHGLNEVVQQFWLALEERRKKAAQEAAKQKSAPARVSTVTAPTPAPAVPVPAPAPAAQPAPPRKPAAAQAQLEFF